MPKSPSSLALLCLVAFPVAMAAQGVRTVQVGTPSARMAEPFDAISGVRELPDGRVLVSDGIAEQVSVVNLGTGDVTPVGRKGRGPGEYRVPDLLFPWPGDSTLLVDLGNARLSLLGPAGAVGRTTRLTMDGLGPGGLTIVLPQATDQKGRVYFRPGGPPTGDTAAVVRWTPGATSFDSVARVGLAETKVTTTGSANNRGQMFRAVPYSPADGWAVGPDGAVFLVRSSDYHVEWVLPDGRTVRGTAVAWKPVPIREKDKQAWADQLASTGLLVSMEVNNGTQSVTLGRGGGRLDEDLGSYEWPDAKPAFRPGGVTVSPTGEGWVERYGPAGEPLAYDVFNRNGARVRQVVIPADRRLVAFGKGTLYLARTDADGLQWLERYVYPR